MIGRILILATALLLPMGCAVTQSTLPATRLAPVHSWAAQFDGMANEPTLQSRAEAALKQLATVQDIPLSIHVLNTSAVGAYAWSDGRLFVTRGLLRVMSDDELTAAIAHEMGHLIADGHLHSHASLAGDNSLLDIESRADRLGASLLAEQGLSPDSMLSMLRKLQNHAPAPLNKTVRHRLKLLQESMR